MKGPGYKVTGDVRRTWRCPKCGRERKQPGDVTTMTCTCQENPWMEIVAERMMEPRPVQRPSDVERRPIDFGIEPTPPAPAKPEATIIKPAVSHDVEPIVEATLVVESTTIEISTNPEPVKPRPASTENVDDDWGEGILDKE